MLSDLDRNMGEEKDLAWLTTRLSIALQCKNVFFQKKYRIKYNQSRKHNAITYLTARYKSLPLLIIISLVPHGWFIII
jgi:hypothetical protein